MLCTALAAAVPIADVSAQPFALARSTDARTCAVVNLAQPGHGAREDDWMVPPFDRLGSLAPDVATACRQLRDAPVDQCLLQVQAVRADCLRAGVDVGARWTLRPAVPPSKPPLPGGASLLQSLPLLMVASVAARTGATPFIYVPDTGCGPAPPKIDVALMPDAMPDALRFDSAGAGAGCGATLVGPRALLTAAHCFKSGGLGPLGAFERQCPGDTAPVRIEVRCEAHPDHAQMPAQPAHDVAFCAPTHADAQLACPGERVARPLASPGLAAGPAWLVGIDHQTRKPVAHLASAPGSRFAPAQCSPLQATALEVDGAPAAVPEPKLDCIMVVPGDSGHGTVAARPGGSGGLPRDGSLLAVNAKFDGPRAYLADLRCGTARSFVEAQAQARKAPVCGLADPAGTLDPAACLAP